MEWFVMDLSGTAGNDLAVKDRSGMIVNGVVRQEGCTGTERSGSGR
jgi:hypothetical protein